MERKLIVNQDHFKLNSEQLYALLCKNIQGKRSAYSITSADHAGIQFSKDEKDFHILKEEIVGVLDGIRKTHEFSIKDLKKMDTKNQAPMMAFLLAGDILY